MFLFLARQLIGLKKIDDPLFTRRYYLLEVSNYRSSSFSLLAMSAIELKYGSIVYSCCESRG